MKTGLKDPAGADLLPTFLHWTYGPTGVAWGTGRHSSPYFFKKSCLTVYYGKMLNVFKWLLIKSCLPVSMKCQVCSSWLMLTNQTDNLSQIASFLFSH